MKNKKNNKMKAFTLVELLAVIVILAVILVIAVPKINSVIDSTRLSTIESTLNMIKKSAEKEYQNRSMLSTLDQDNNPIGCSDVVNLSGTDYGSCKITFDNDGVATVTLYGKGKFDKYKCSNNVCSTYTPVEVYQEEILNGAYPRLDEGMIPVTIANDGTVTTVNPYTDYLWYSYGDSNDAGTENDKRWANVVLVKENATEGVTGSHSREFYKNSNNYGTTIVESDILAYLVWIPRYNYKLFNVGNTAVSSKSIEIEFENATSTKKTGKVGNTYTLDQKFTHPAFTYDGKELNGIWVGKFETSTGSGITPTIKPHLSGSSIISLRGQNVSTQFKTSLKFTTDTQYGITGESRMSMNSDWGAVAYLSHSDYGLGEVEIEINNNGSYWPGSGTDKVYGGTLTYPQSTTGNIYGVFDMNGGAWEYVMGVLDDGSGNGYSGNSEAYNSGYNGKLGTTNTYKTDGISFPNKKYYKIYTEGVNSFLHLGEALGETRGWHDDYQGFVVAAGPWFERGGRYADGVSAGGFAFSIGHGYAYSSNSFRVVVLAE